MNCQVSGGFSGKIFLSKPLEIFECPLCFEILKDPQQCSRGHCFCYSCISAALHKNSECPVCKVHLTNDLLNKGLLINQQIENLPTICISRDTEQRSKCKWTGPLHGRNRHYEVECDFFPVECNNDGCNISGLTRKSIIKHKQTCEFSPISCEFCQHLNHQTYLRRNLSEHQFICDFRLVSCPQKCSELVPNIEMTSHIKNDCSKTIVDCPFLFTGQCIFCPIKAERSVIIQHMLNDRSVFDTFVDFSAAFKLKDKENDKALSQIDELSSKLYEAEAKNFFLRMELKHLHNSTMGESESDKSRIAELEHSNKLLSEQLDYVGSILKQSKDDECSEKTLQPSFCSLSVVSDGEKSTEASQVAPLSKPISEVSDIEKSTTICTSNSTTISTSHDACTELKLINDNNIDSSLNNSVVAPSDHRFAVTEITTELPDVKQENVQQTLSKNSKKNAKKAAKRKNHDNNNSNINQSGGNIGSSLELQSRNSVSVDENGKPRWTNSRIITPDIVETDAYVGSRAFVDDYHNDSTLITKATASTYTTNLIYKIISNLYNIWVAENSLCEETIALEQQDIQDFICFSLPYLNISADNNEFRDCMAEIFYENEHSLMKLFLNICGNEQRASVLTGNIVSFAISMVENNVERMPIWLETQIAVHKNGFIGGICSHPLYQQGFPIALESGRNNVKEKERRAQLREQQKNQQKQI